MWTFTFRRHPKSTPKIMKKYLPNHSKINKKSMLEAIRDWVQFFLHLGAVLNRSFNDFSTFQLQNGSQNGLIKNRYRGLLASRKGPWTAPDPSRTQFWIDFQWFSDRFWKNSGMILLQFWSDSSIIQIQELNRKIRCPPRGRQAVKLDAYPP